MVENRSLTTGPIRTPTTTTETPAISPPLNATPTFDHAPDVNPTATVAASKRSTTGPLLPDAAIPAPMTAKSVAATTRQRTGIFGETVTLRARSMRNAMLPPKVPAATNVEKARNTIPDRPDHASRAYWP